jgi:hypothetical protein
MLWEKLNLDIFSSIPPRVELCFSLVQYKETKTCKGYIAIVLSDFTSLVAEHLLLALGAAGLV